ncbi:MAG TPA: hypothetical protein PKB14_11175 [Rubrivivax sp.]|nr:hypothetical protein [Rubrivivax sp.]
MTPLTSILIALLLVMSADARADRPLDWTEGELAVLPDYCRDTQGFNHTRTGPQKSPRADYWVSLMGETFWSVHHYCWGLMNQRRAQMAGVSRQQREHLIDSAIRDYQFVVRNMQGRFVLLPEILTRIGEAHLLLKQYAAANDAFLRAREVKPDYWPPYASWAEAQLQLGLKAGARQTVEAALQYLPEEPRILALAKRADVPAETIAAAQTAARRRDQAASAPPPAPASSGAPTP